MSTPDLFIIAGESSGDLYGEKIIRALIDEKPDFSICAIAGPSMRTCPIKTVMHMEELNVMGFIDVIKTLPSILKKLNKIADWIIENQPKQVLFIDYPGFNIRLAEKLRKKGYAGTLTHFICPSVWAWGKGRIPKMAKVLDQLLTLFPFEKKYFQSTDLPVFCVGHPLSKEIPLIERPIKPVQQIGLFPGSRDKEIERNLPLQIQVAKKLLEQNPSLKIALSLSHPRFLRKVLTITKEEDLPSQNFTLYSENSQYEMMDECDLALATSGTVTLELALHNIPTVINYAITPLDQFIAQKLLGIRLPFYGLANIILEKEVFPELFGPSFTLDKTLSKMKAFIEDDTLREKCIEECKSLRKILGDTESIKEVARKILNKPKKQEPALCPSS